MNTQQPGPVAPSAVARNQRQKTPGSMSATSATASAAASSSRQQSTSSREPSVQPVATNLSGPRSSSMTIPASHHAEARRPSQVKSHAAQETQPAQNVVQKAPTIDVKDEKLAMLSKSLGDLRSVVTCKICDRLLYQPFVISCGHTYCYSCLCTWFVNNKSKKTCPDCRASVTQPPAPAYLIREMALHFISKLELLPEGETMEQHQQWQQEESDAVQQDKNNNNPKTGGLFKGCFKTREVATTLRTIRDDEDGVDRCPLCTWEVEDGMCAQCGLQFDDDGQATFGNGFGGFSDMDEASEHDMSGEEIDAEFDMRDAEFDYDMDDYMGEGMGEWYDDQHTIRRWLHNNRGPSFQTASVHAHRRRAAHSAAGSSRRSYSASIVSDFRTEDAEMDTLAEEDEEDEEDSSMNDFIDDATETGSVIDRSETPRLTSPAVGHQRRPRRVLESDTSSMSTPDRDNGEDEEEGPVDRRFRRQAPRPTGARLQLSPQDGANGLEADDDADEDGPISSGRRSQMNRSSRLGRRGPIALSDSTDENSEDRDSGGEEDTRALLRDGWSPLEPENQDEEMIDDEGDDSDGARTTVGWEPIANSTNRARIDGSLTPTADRPNPTIRPPSRTRNNGFRLGTRGLRQRSSVLSNPPSHYEDGEADDDDSDAERPMDRDGDVNMIAASLRPRTSRTRLNSSMRVQNAISPVGAPSPQIGQGEGESEDGSDDSVAPGRRGQRRRARQAEYDPLVALRLNQFYREMNGLGQDQLDQLRARTPVSRPRTSNRHRTIQPSIDNVMNQSPPDYMRPYQQANPLRTRTPLLQQEFGPTYQVGHQYVQDTTINRGAIGSSPRTYSAPDFTSGGSINVRDSSMDSSTSMPAAPSPTFYNGYVGVNNSLSNPITQNDIPFGDPIDRPMSRASYRPPSAAGRRGANIPLGIQSPGLNFAARSMQARNPWAPFVRPRPSRQTLREQSSTATLRPRTSQRALVRQPSQVSIHDSGVMPQHMMRAQTSRMNLRPQQSQQRLRSQTQQRPNLPNEAVPTPSIPQNSPAPLPDVRMDSLGSRLSEDERTRRGRELANRRAEELRRNNPYAASVGRQLQTNRSSMTAGSVANVSQPATYQPITSNGTVGQLNTLGRRRSNRTLGAPLGVLPSTRSYDPAATVRPRAGQSPGSPTFESQVSSSRTSMSPIAQR